MDFEELLAKADSNARKQNKKVREADQEMEFKKRRNLERLAIQKKIEKENIKRRAPPRLPSPEKPKVCCCRFIFKKFMFYFSLLFLKKKRRVKLIKIKLLFF